MNRFQLSFFSLFRKTSPRVNLDFQTESDSLLYPIWCDLQEEYFPSLRRIQDYRLEWSKRNQLRTLATCHIDKKKVIVARELNTTECQCWLPPLLYHEMCHAVIGRKLSRDRRKHIWHGPEFRALEAAHPEMAAFNAWVKDGGWQKAIRSHRARQAHQRRRSVAD